MSWAPFKYLVILLFVMFATMFAVIYLGGCYDAHAAEPCEDSGALAEDKRQLPALAVDSDSGMQVSPGGVDRERSPDVECAGPIVAGECYADLEDWLSR